jgi:hypothetical protein
MGFDAPAANVVKKPYFYADAMVARPAGRGSVFCALFSGFVFDVNRTNRFTDKPRGE